MSGIERREFLRAAVGATVAALPGCLWGVEKVELITPNVTLVRGAVNGVRIVRSGGTVTVYGDPSEQPAPAKMVLFTHHRRDVLWAGRAMVEGGAQAVVPEAEKQWFEGAGAFWEDYRTRRFHDYANQSSRISAEPLPVSRTVREGDTIQGIQVLETPGYTRGSVSYLIESEGRRIACTGDLIYGDGRLLDLYSLQDAIPEVHEDGYHGYAARAGQMIASLRKIADWEPDVLLPARGPAIRNPEQAIGRLIGSLRAALASHFSIDALRWYRGDDKLRAMTTRVLGSKQLQWMPMAEIEAQLPDWMMAITNSRLLISRSGAGFLVDCGNRQVVEEIRRLLGEGRVRKLDGIYITHYHDDHTDMAQAAADEFRCPVYFCREQTDILAHPEAYRMPCLTSNPIRSGQPMEEGARQRWNEFEFTYSYFPGQTTYHGGLVARHDSGTSMFFVGDSFTPTGMDDYCLLNRNFLAPEKGFLNCLRQIRELQGDYLLVNQHVAPAFRFSPQQLDTMMANFTRRRELLTELFPWNDPNFGVDEQWARFYPYSAEVAAGSRLVLEVIVRNHAAGTQEFRVTPRVPAGWQAPAGPLRVSVPARSERAVRVPVTAGRAGLAILTADVSFGEWELREWTEAMVSVK